MPSAHRTVVLPAAVPCARPRHRRDAAAAHAAGAAFRRGRRGSARRRCSRSAPTVLFTVPRYLQKFASQILVAFPAPRASSASTYELADARSRARHARGRWDGRGRPGMPAVMHALRAGLVFRPMLTSSASTSSSLSCRGGAPLPAETMALWHMWGVNVVEMYGQTETRRRHHRGPARARSRARATSAPYREAAR